MTTKEIEKIIALLEYLDGRGIIFEDEELVKKELKTEAEKTGNA